MTFSNHGSANVARTTLDVVLFCLVVAVYGFFHGGGWHNQNSRFDALVAFVEPGTPDHGSFRIDRFRRDKGGRLVEPSERVGNTMDWSWYPPAGRASPNLELGQVQGHYYSNKAPGPILLGIPVYAALYFGEGWLGLDPHAGTLVEFNLYAVNFVVSVLVVAVGIVVFRRLLVLVGCGDAWAVFLALVLAFATLMFPYSTQLWGHPTAAAFVIMAVYGLVRDTPRSLAAAGLFVGFAALSDYLAIFVVLALGTMIAVTRPRRLVCYLVGGLAPLAVFMAYHWICFGSPLVTAMTFTAEEFKREGHAIGFFGSVSVNHVFALLTSRQRGVLVHMPILILSLVGIVRWLRSHPRDRLLWLCISIIVAFILINASFNGWHAGAVVGSRYQIVALPFWVICLSRLPAAGLWRRAALVLAVLSAFNMLAVAAVSPNCLPWSPDWSDPSQSPQYANPFWTPGQPADLAGHAAASAQHPLFYDTVYGYTYLQFWTGGLAAEQIRKLMFLGIHRADYWHPTNVGLVLGLPGLASLTPLLLVGGLGLWLLRRALTPHVNAASE